VTGVTRWVSTGQDNPPVSARVIPTTWRSTSEHLRQLSDGINQAADGRSNAIGSLTLTASTTTTATTDRRVATDSVILLTPKTANAATAIATTFVSAVTAESFTLTHAHNAETDRDFDYAIIG
jgi:hypothetical protein